MFLTWAILQSWFFFGYLALTSSHCPSTYIFHKMHENVIFLYLFLFLDDCFFAFFFFFFFDDLLEWPVCKTLEIKYGALTIFTGLYWSWLCPFIKLGSSTSAQWTKAQEMYPWFGFQWSVTELYGKYYSQVVGATMKWRGLLSCSWFPFITELD